ncbi:MAG: hypothetical protein ACXWG1_13140 [Usitatibacter sp.]
MLKKILLGCLLGLALAGPAAATSVLPLYLDEIVDQASVAFQGTCVANRTARDPDTGMIVTYTTFQVQDALKGAVGATHTIKQIGGELPAEGVGFRIHSVPTFTVGESYVVFLAGASSLGFSSPMGLGQGRFSIIAGDGGLEVSNGRDFKELTARMGSENMTKSARSALAAPGAVSHIPLEDLKSLVRQHLSGVQR